MKRTLTTLTLTLGLAGLFVPAPLAAQNHTAVADVPFAFNVAGRTLPAGHYNVSQLRSSGPVFSVSGEDGKTIMSQFGVNETGHPDKPSLTFRKSGDQYTLVKITPPDSLLAYSKPEPKEKSQTMRMASMISIKLK